MSTAIAYPASRFEVTPSIELGDTTSRARVSTASVGAMARLATTWGLTVEQMGTLLGGVAPSTWHSWVKNPPKDAWKRDFYFSVPGANGRPYDLISAGEDGTLGTADDIDWAKVEQE